MLTRLLKHPAKVPQCQPGGARVAFMGGAWPVKPVEDLDAQCRQMFANVRRVIEAAGGTPDDIVKMTVWITDRAL
jgi:enamine deaminase RidA (YjgF/YER057c/UK114 family)